MLVSVLDTETTGLDAQDGGLVELARVVVCTQQRRIVRWAHSLTQPGCPIGLEAMATHHITEDMLEGAPEPSLIIDLWFGAPGERTRETMVAHNAAFDAAFLPPDLRPEAGVPWICTWRAAMHLWPDAPSHKNQFLRYWLGLDVSDMPEEAGGMAHRALYDTWVSAKLLLCMLETHSVDELVTLRTAPVMLRRVPFGKHRGETWDRVPSSYLDWMRRQSDLSPDVRYTLDNLGR